MRLNFFRSFFIVITVFAIVTFNILDQLFLRAFLFFISLFFLFLCGAEFVGVTLLIIYLGALIILFLFVLRMVYPNSILIIKFNLLNLFYNYMGLSIYLVLINFFFYSSPFFFNILDDFIVSYFHIIFDSNSLIKNCFFAIESGLVLISSNIVEIGYFLYNDGFFIFILGGFILGLVLVGILFLVADF